MESPSAHLYNGVYIMASNTRGRIKERFEGIHKDFDWVLEHCSQCLTLIADKNPAMTKAIDALARGTKTLDELARDIYHKI
ncbi:unnamed protein product [marine sediment metagenome]|uniref:Uncharacterized protein n=1 Tax=marine sediment metagenome TaxID=412755 RepID=X1L9V5_9ZZZZ